MLELHVWGPGFGLPSIDPLCLSAIAYLKFTVPHLEWNLIQSSNPLLSPSKSLPALRDGRTWITGFHPIIDYLRQQYPTSDLDGILSDREKATCTAFTAHIQSRAQEIIDLSLYVSSQNFAAVTRPLYSQILPWPVQYYLPLALRAAARERTRTLGLSAIDIVTTDSAQSVCETPVDRAIRGTTAPESVLPPATAANIKLVALCDEFLDALRRRLGSKRFWFGDDAPASVDCVAVGYLALLLLPEVPHAFAMEAMRRQPRLCAYVHDLRVMFFPEPQPGRVERGDMRWLIGVLVDRARDAVFGARGGGEEEWADDDPVQEERKKKVIQGRKWESWKSAAFVVGGVVAMAGYVAWSGIIAFQVGTKEKDGMDEDEEVDRGSE